MRRSSGKKRVQRTKMAKKPMRKKTTKKGKNPWLQHVGQVFAELKKQDPNISYKQAIIEARKTYKKQAAQPVPEVEDSWNVSSSKYSTVGKKKKGSAKKKKGKSRRRRRSRRHGGDFTCTTVQHKGSWMTRCRGVEPQPAAAAVEPQPSS